MALGTSERMFRFGTLFDWRRESHPNKPDWYNDHGWMRVCWQCLPEAREELAETERPDTSWCWEPFWLIRHKCDRCGARFRRFAELYAMDWTGMENDYQIHLACEHDWKDSDEGMQTCEKCKWGRLK